MEKKISFVLIVGLLILICPYAVTAASDAVLVLHFDEGSGFVAHDSSGHGNDGIIYDATWVDGISAKGLRFDGQRDYVDINDLNLSSDWAIEYWAVSDSTSSNVYYPIGLGGETGLGMGGKYHTINNDFYVWDGKNIVHSGPQVIERTWYFVTVNKNKVHYEIYINGAITTSGTLDDINIKEVNIGRRTDNYWYFDGMIDEVAIYPRALSPSEIQSHYLAKRADPTPTPTPTPTSTPTTVPTTPKPAISATLIKSVNPQTIKQNQSVTITVTIENIGITPFSDIEIIDKVPSEFDFLNGETQSAYSSLKSGESRIIQYTLQSAGAGKFTLDAATARFVDQSGNYQTITSNTPTIEVLAPLSNQPITTKAPGFGVVLSVVGLLILVAIMRKRK